MKKFSKILLITAGVFAVTGAALSVSGAAMGATLEGVEVVENMRAHFQEARNEIVHLDWDEEDWDEEDYDDDDWQEGRHQSQGQGLTEGMDENGIRFFEYPDISDIDVEVRHDEVIFQAYDGEMLRVEVENDESGEVSVRREGRELEIKNTAPAKERVVRIFYPEETEFGSLSLYAAEGSISMEDDVYARELELKTGTGEIVNRGALDVQELDLETDAGDIEIVQTSASKIDAENGTGSIQMELEGDETDYSYELECRSGNIVINGQEYTSIPGEKTLRNADAYSQVNLECGSGSILLNFEEA